MRSINRSEPDLSRITRRRKRQVSLPEPLQPHSPASSFYMACHQAFAAVELLETVLLNLEMRELLRIQRVSRHWQALIQTSPSLQRKMFLGFVPQTGDLSRFVYDNSHPPADSATTAPHLIVKGVPGRDIFSITNPSTASLGVLPEAPDEPLKQVVFNSVFPSEGQTIRMQTSQFRVKSDARESWLDMYLTQMPCNEAHVGLYFIRKREWTSRFGLVRRSDEPVVLQVSVRREEGVKARDVLETLRSSCGAEDVRRWQRIDIRIPGVVKAEVSNQV